MAGQVGDTVSSSLLRLRGTDIEFPSRNTNFDLGMDGWCDPDGDLFDLDGFAEGGECDLPQYRPT